MAKFKMEVQEVSSYYLILEADSKEDLIENFDEIIESASDETLKKAEQFDFEINLVNKDMIEEQN
jgi:hypothetical protein|tara:strand:+ start:70 stop:264 length:195 start_codon:yes stop_codon:yes gene_type:complete